MRVTKGKKIKTVIMIMVFTLIILCYYHFFPEQLSEFLAQYLSLNTIKEIRGMKEILMAFIYYNEVTTHWDKRSWMLLTVFTLLSAYTQF